MGETSKQDQTQRVLLVAPTAKDADITSALLERAGLQCVACQNIRRLTSEVEYGAGAVLLTEDAIVGDDIDHLLSALNRQPSWSDLPIIVLMRGGGQSLAASRVLKSMRNVTLLERPAPTRSMVSAVLAAVRGRLRQYQIRDQLEQLRAADEERTALLMREQSARSDADRANRMKDEFLATLSHELRTPLNAILGWAQLLQRAADDPATLQEGLIVIERNARAQTQLIEDLLDMSRIVSGKVKLDLQRFDVGSVIHTAVDVVRPVADAKGVTLFSDTPASPAFVRGDPVRIQQVIWNLLSNAVKFTPGGGNVTVRLEQDSSSVRIIVADTGEGIEPEFLPQMFERFRQANSSTTRRHGGLGLGLSIARHLVDIHGGSIRAESEGKGRGSSFTVSLPRVAAAEKDDSSAPRLSHGGPAADATAPQLEGLTILLVDDELDTRRLVKRVLEDRLAKVVTAESSAAALRALREVVPDVIVSDIGMPEQDGYEFLRLARKQGVKAPAVALTAFARAEDKVRSLRAGFQEHVAKPVEVSTLIAAVASTAGRS